MASCKALFDKALTQDQQSRENAIIMDMWKPYMETTKESLGNAVIVHDRFHLVKYLNEVIDKVRRKEVKQHHELMNSRYALLKNPDNLTEKQRIHFEAIAGASYQVNKAWQVRENFKQLFHKFKVQTWQLFNRWASDSLKQKIKEVDKVVAIFQNHVSGVVAALINT